MRQRLLLICAIAVFATSAFAKDVYLSIGGSINNFRTDTRIFNSSSTKDIQIQASLLPLGKDSNNSNVQPKTITVPKRSMVEYDDVVSSLFGATGLGGIRLSSSDDFVATHRVYSTAADGSTNGQFVAGVDSANALMKGVITQMKSNPAPFRTNRGIVNPNSVPANVTWQVYDRNNNPAGQPFTETLAPFAVVGPTAVSVPSANLTDMWLSFSSDQAVIAYGSVIDNLNSAGTYVAAAADDATPLTSPRDIYLSIGGSINNFRTDTRIFNPSSTKDIQIQAYLLPIGNVDNSGVQPKTITVAKRSMAVYDDVVSSLFGATGLGGIRLTSSDNFIATQRVYSTAADGSTNGQFVAGVDEATAMKNGVVVQMKANGAGAYVPDEYRCAQSEQNSGERDLAHLRQKQQPRRPAVQSVDAAPRSDPAVGHDLIRARKRQHRRLERHVGHLFVRPADPCVRFGDRQPQ